MINILAVGKLPKWLEEGVHHYLKQMRNITITTLKTSNKSKENNELLKRLNKNAYLVVLDEKGEGFTSTEFAGKIKSLLQQTNTIEFVIGGADGLSEEIKSQADWVLSLSSATMPHTLARLVLVEQLYRAFSINNNHPYHRE